MFWYRMWRVRLHTYVTNNTTTVLVQAKNVILRTRKEGIVSHERSSLNKRVKDNYHDRLNRVLKHKRTRGCYRYSSRCSLFTGQAKS